MTSSVLDDRFVWKPPDPLVKAQLWVDTCVMTEVYSHADAHNAAFASNRDRAWTGANVERRRMMQQGSLWLAMALDDQGTTTLSFHHELMRTLHRLAPRDSDVAAWTSVALYVLREHVFPNWRVLVTSRGHELPECAEGNNARDSLMVELAKEEGIPVVTRDRRGKHGRPSAYGLARERGVEPFTPERYAARVLPFATARDRFMDRLIAGARSFVAASNDKHVCQMAMAEVLYTHWIIWQPAGLIMGLAQPGHYRGQKWVPFREVGAGRAKR